MNSHIFNYKRDLLLKNPSLLDQKITKVHLKTSLKRGLSNRESLLPAAFYLEMVTAQKAIGCRSKKSSSSLKVRKGDIIGWEVTLRNKKMDNFLVKFLNSLLPVEEKLYKVTNLASFFELNEQILPDNISIHIAISTKFSGRNKDIYLSGLNLPILNFQRKQTEK